MIVSALKEGQTGGYVALARITGLRALGIPHWRRERDSNPRRAINPHTLSRRAS